MVDKFKNLILDIRAEIWLLLFSVMWVSIGTTYILTGNNEKTVETQCPEVNEQDWKPLTNDQIISETKKCNDAGLNAEGLRIESKFGAQFVAIQCVPKSDK